MKYKAGDNVRLRTDLEVGRIYGEMNYTETMYRVHKPGSVVVIENPYSSFLRNYYVKGHDKPWWTEEMFSGLVVDADPEPQPKPEDGPKFKVGDKVRIREDLKRGKYGSCYACSQMAYHAGKVVTIRKHAPDCSNRFFIEESLPGCMDSWHWSEEMMEGLAEPAPAPALDTGWSWEDLF